MEIKTMTFKQEMKKKSSEAEIPTSSLSAGGKITHHIFECLILAGSKMLYLSMLSCLWDGAYKRTLPVD